MKLIQFYYRNHLLINRTQFLPKILLSQLALPFAESLRFLIKVVIMFYKVELICHHPPHKCKCRHNIATEVNTEDLTSNLIKCNPALLKYLGKSSTKTQTPSPQTQQIDGKQQPVNDGPKQYRSIVEEKGLNFILKDNYIAQPQPLPAKSPSPKHRPPSPLSHPPQQHPQTNPAANHPKSPKSPKPPKPIQSQRQKNVKNYHKDLRQQSRYLSNTAFRKYFDRQCFQNYGNQNVHHKGDGFVYGNYLKTYNINPHTGNNIPVNEQTFYHALVSASPNKYALQTQEVKLAQTGKSQKSPQKQQEKRSLQKEPINVEQMLQDNLKHSHFEKKYEHIKLKSKENFQKQSQLQGRSPRVLSVTPSPNLQHNQSQLSPKQLPLQSRKYIPRPQETNNTQKNQEIIRNQYTLRQHAQSRLDKPAESILVQRQQVKFKEESSIPHCQHQPGQQSSSCECCLNQMKGLILSLAQSDPDLADRIVSSAKKATLYKNYALNNYQQASMNPHNYTSSGRLNTYQ